jgi:hypothetical protein
MRILLQPQKLWRPCVIRFIYSIINKPVSLLPWRRQGGEDVQFICIPDHGTRWEWVVSVTPRPGFIPGERTRGTHWFGGWVDLRAGLDTEAREKILQRWCVNRSVRNINHLSVYIIGLLFHIREFPVEIWGQITASLNSFVVFFNLFNQMRGYYKN